MRRRALSILICCLFVAGCAASRSGTTRSELQREVMATERAFAKTMVDRDHTAFASFVADEAVFFAGPGPLRGKQQVVAWWARYYAAPNPPFSWEPDEVEVLDSGALALSSGPVRDPDGKLIARFSSIWRRTASNTWEIIFDKGSEVCNCKTP